jgi:transposase-like protein
MCAMPKVMKSVSGILSFDKAAVMTDREKLAVLAMLGAGQATVAEVARLVGASRQTVAYVARRIDITAARDKLLRQQFAAALEVVDRKAKTNARRPV